MTKYEVMYIVRANLDEEGIKNVIAELSDAFTSNNSQVLECKEWGLRELAYEINKFTTGYYFLYVVEANAETVKEFDRIVRINESLLRHLIVKVEE